MLFIVDWNWNMIITGIYLRENGAVAGQSGLFLKLNN
jgi:hypothetical protein